ncbi:MAG: sensor histidine kinase KdpD [Chloroflexaceae bacterium]|nr:sensor histidine kinase KdpD [Chloroflexaceae bacterium]
MADRRPNPDELLARVQAAEQARVRGKLKIFFGAAAGVGKTYAMLDEARQRQADGVDVVIGWVETHGRAETAALVEGLEKLAPRPLSYRGTTLQEFDLDAALARQPALLLLDELAHTNAPGSRHAKRWQDLRELLEEGIDVYTTVNVQHIESLRDVVAQITGIVVHETVPDAIIDEATEIEVVDIPPDELLQRLHDGKVYLPQQAHAAAHNFFRKGNLIALRELVLRHAADRVDTQMQDYRRDHAITETWPTTERLLVAVSTNPAAQRLVRAGCRMATRLKAEWLVVYVESAAAPAERDRAQITRTLNLAEQLGAETAILTGNRVAEEVLVYARTRNVTRILVGKPAPTNWRTWFARSFADAVVRGSGDMDVIFITGIEEQQLPPQPPLSVPPAPWPEYGWVLLTVTLCTVIGVVFAPAIGISNVILLYLTGVIGLATRFRRSSLVLASVLSVLAFNFFFTTPYYSLEVDNPQYILTLAVMLMVALFISTLTVRIREQARAARQREQRTATLYALSRAYAAARDQASILAAVARHISNLFGSPVALLLPDEQGRLRLWQEPPTLPLLAASEQGVAQWVYDHGQPAGLGTNTLPSAGALYMPLQTTQRVHGVLGISPTHDTRLLEPDQRHLLETIASQTALALERAALAVEAQQAQVQVETEQLRSALLSSVSHDFRTPLAAITGAASSLLTQHAALPAATTHDLLSTIAEEAERLSRLVQNLLEMTRIESGTIRVNKAWQPLDDVVGAVLSRLTHQLDGRTMTVEIPADLPLVPLDEVLIEQVLINLLDNALKYTPAGSPLELAATVEHDAQGVPTTVVVMLADWGPGLPPGAEQRVFEKFFRADAAASGRGAGLGLAICQSMVEAHGGRIWAASRSEGGAVFWFSLPLDGSPPLLDAPSPEVQGGNPQ